MSGPLPAAYSSPVCPLETVKPNLAFGGLTKVAEVYEPSVQMMRSVSSRRVAGLKGVGGGVSHATMYLFASVLNLKVR